VHFCGQKIRLYTPIFIHADHPTRVRTRKWNRTVF
jgi:hypothetical protein